MNAMSITNEEENMKKKNSAGESYCPVFWGKNPISSFSGSRN